MMYKIAYTKRFEKSLKLCKKRGLNIDRIKTAIKTLEENGKLPAEYKPHRLKGN